MNKIFSIIFIIVDKITITISILGYPNALILLTKVYPTELKILNKIAIFKYCFAKILTFPVAPIIYSN